MNPEMLIIYCLPSAQHLLGTIKVHPHYKLKFTSILPITSSFISISYDHEKPEIMNKAYFHLRHEGRQVNTFCFGVA